MPLSPSSIIWYRCRGKFVAPGKFFPPPYCHSVTNANLNPNTNLNPSPNPNPNLNPTPNLNPNPKFNPILNFNPNPYCCVWEEFSGATNFPLHRFHRWDVNRHTARYTGSVSVVMQCKNLCLAEGQGNGDQHRPMSRKPRERLRFSRIFSASSTNE